MNILILCVKFPYPPKDGGAIAMMSMIRAYHNAGHELTVLAMNTPKHYFADINDMPEHIKELAEFIAVDLDTSVNYIDAAANLVFSQDAYHVKRFTSEGFENTLKEILKEKTFDIVQMETLFMTPYVSVVKKQDPKPLVVLRAHNVEHEIWERLANNKQHVFKQYYFKETARRIAIYEKNAFKKGLYDAVLPISEKDKKKFEEFAKEHHGAVMGDVEKKGYKMAKDLKEKFGVPKELTDQLEKRGPEPVLIRQIKKKVKASPPMHIISVGIDFNDYPEPDYAEAKHPKIGYIGAMDWKANQEGVNWFLDKVWSKVKGKYPEAIFYLAGRNMPGDYQQRQDAQTIVLGEVEDAGEFLRSISIMVVPLMSGSGMRVKIVEGMAMGKAIVATSVAVEGIPAKHNEHLLIADKPNIFADQLSALIEDEARTRRMGRHARAFSENTFSDQKVTADLFSFLEGLKK